MPADARRETATTPAGGSADRQPVWHTAGIEQTAEALRTDAAAGLTSEEAAGRLAEGGRNELRPSRATPPWRIFVAQFNDFMIWVLGVAVLISALEGEIVDAIAILAILLLNGVLGFLQEYRAERALLALQEMAAPAATVLRDGAERQLPAAELVPGDVVLLASGDLVPADGRLVEAAVLRIDESSLTGESSPARKHLDPLEDEDVTLGDRHDMVFASTAASVGRGRFIVTATGSDTEVGRIARLLDEQVEESTPLQRELKSVGKRIALLVLAVAAVVFAVGAWQAWRASGLPLPAASGLPAFRERITVALLVAISLAVAAIPEGLPAIVTVALSLGVRRMAERNAIIRKLHAVETLGATTFICSDKTGTLTRNEMRVRRMIVGLDDVELLPDWAEQPFDRTPDAADRALLLEIAAACNDARASADGTLVGDPTETALLAAADNLAPGERLRPRRIGEVPFDSERKRMTTTHERDGAHVAYMKGAADVVLGLCSHARLHGETVELTEELIVLLLERAEALAAKGYRTLALAMRPLSATEPVEGETLERDMVYVGILGIVDPPRPEVPEALATCRTAGIHVAMITGDHALTARAIGEEIGLLDGDERVLTGRDLEHMTEGELAAAVEDTRVYARVDPVHKLRIVDALKAHGEVVAMTGDGVNDAPALKRADIGIAMGLIGTDVSREAADMVLADDDFATIVEAVREGRGVFDNLRKVILFLLSCNVSEVLIVLTTTFLAAGPALLPLQLLWINLVTDGLPALALGVDPAAPGIMERPPRSAADGILAGGRLRQVIWQGSLLTAAGLIVYVWAGFLMPGHSVARAQTMLFTAMVLVQLLHAFGFRSDRRTVWSADSLRNRWLVLALLGSMTLQVLVIYLPPLQQVFNTVALSGRDWLAVGISALLPVAAIDILKVTTAGRRRAG
jgi:Ca2+-transporting ATPase